MTFSHTYGMISLRRLSKPDIRLKTGNWMGKFDKTFYRTYLRWQMSRNVQKVYLYNAFHYDRALLWGATGKSYETKPRSL